MLSYMCFKRKRKTKKIVPFLIIRKLKICSFVYFLQKKLSVSATVSQALEYIPELQEQVNMLIKKKDELSFRISGQKDLLNTNQNDKPEKGYASTVSATNLGETGLMVQISSLQTVKCSFGNVLSGLEEDGLVLVDASSSRSQGERLFYTLHLQMDNCNLNFEELRSRLLYLYEKCWNSFTWFKKILYVIWFCFLSLSLKLEVRNSMNLLPNQEGFLF